MSGRIQIEVKCPHCGRSLINPDIQLDQLDSIHLAAKIGPDLGSLYLSQIYGSYLKRFEKIEDVPNAVVECSCPHCHTPFPVHGVCECGAPIIGLDLKVGGVIKVCTRNGCRRHWLEFENADDAFYLFQCQSETDLA